MDPMDKRNNITIGDLFRIETLGKEFFPSWEPLITARKRAREREVATLAVSRFEELWLKSVLSYKSEPS
jgi:hypothetical protein